MADDPIPVAPPNRTEEQIQRLSAQVQRFASKIGLDNGDPYGLPRGAVNGACKSNVATLCSRCTNSRTYRRASDNDYTVICQVVGVAPSFVIPPDIVECSSFHPQNEMTLYQMVRLATLISDCHGDTGHYL